MLDRLRRKWERLRRYPALAASSDQRRDLWLLGLVHERVLTARRAARLTTTRARWIQPRLNACGGEHVRVELEHDGQLACFDELFLDRIYDLHVVTFVPDLIADCGAYCGYFAALARGFFPDSRLVCFEANPDHIAMLQAQLAVLSKPAELQARAVYTHNGEVTFRGGGLGGTVEDTMAPPAGSRRVPAIDFPAWLSAQRTQRLIWKLDVEGAESALLPAVLPVLPRNTVIFLETHLAEPECAAVLEPYLVAGFKCQEVRRRPAAGLNFDYVEWNLIRGGT